MIEYIGILGAGTILIAIFIVLILLIQDKCYNYAFALIFVLLFSVIILTAKLTTVY